MQEVILILYKYWAAREESGDHIYLFLYSEPIPQMQTVHQADLGKGSWKFFQDAELWNNTIIMANRSF